MPTQRKPVSNPKCTVCRHPDRHAIEMAHVAGASLDAITAKFSTDAHPLGRASVHRHCRDHLDETARASYLADVPLAELAERAAKESLSLLSYLGLIRSTLITQMLVAAGVNDGNRTAVLAGRALEVLKELGRLTGELRDVATHTTINNTLIMNMPIFLDLQTMLVEKLADFPEALERVVDGLRELEGRSDVEPLTLPPATTGENHARD